METNEKIKPQAKLLFDAVYWLINKSYRALCKFIQLHILLW